ncbi:hypothetical protein BN133_2626 [Cronobacter dublinensis 582]|nr:hypothetical protein BN133_2626 [Cronobacter dublinensis 582]
MRNLHAATGQLHLPLRQPFFRRIPADIRLTGKEAARLRLFGHKRLDHREVKTVEIDLRAAAGARVDGLRYAQFGVRVAPAVRANGDFLLLTAIIERQRAAQRPRADRRGEAGIVYLTAPAHRLTVKAAAQVKLAGNGLALHAQRHLVRFLVAFGRKRNQPQVDIALHEALDTQIQRAANLIGGFHIAQQTHLGHGEFLPAQIARGHVGVKLRRLDVAADFHQPFRRAAKPRQRVIECGRVNRRIQRQIFNAKLAFDIRFITPQLEMQAGDCPLKIAVALKLPVNLHLILFNVARKLQLRHVKLPGAAVEAAAQLHQPVELRRPVRILFGGIDALERELAAPADGLLPVEQRLQRGMPFERRDIQLIDSDLLFVAFAIERNGGGRQLIAFHSGTERQRVVGHFAGKLQFKIVRLILFRAGERPVKLLAGDIQIKR